MRWSRRAGEKQAAFERLCQALAAAGATLVEHTDLAGSAAIGSIMFYEFQACLNRYLADCGPGAGARSLAQLIAWNQAHAPAALRYGQDLLLAVQRETDGRMTQPAYRNALASRTRCIDALDRLLDRHALDLMLCLSDTALAALTGFPALTIPIGTDGDGVPLDSCWIARRGDERTLLRAAYAAEAALACARFPAL